MNETAPSNGPERPVTVLHVEDDEAFLDVAAEQLEIAGEGFEVLQATSVEKAQAIRDREDVDCIVADYDMGDGTGVDLLETVREEAPSLPFLLFTGKGSEVVASEAISAGVTDYLQKTTGVEQFTVLANRIEGAVARYRAERRARRKDRQMAVIREIDGLLVDATTRAEIAGDVTETLVDVGPYGQAWMGNLDDEGQHLSRWGSAGVEEPASGGWRLPTAAPVRAAIDRALETGRVVTERVGAGESVLHGRDVTPRDGTLQVVRIGSEDGTPTILAARLDATGELEDDPPLLGKVAEDVARALRRAETQRHLEHQQSVLQAVVETVPQGILVVDDDRDFFTFNQEFVDMWEIPPAVIEPGDEELALDHVLDSLADPEAFRERVEYFYDNPTETSRDLIDLADRRTFERFTAPVTDGSDSTYYGRVWTFQDVTERERRRSELERYETLVEEAASGVFAQDAAGRYTFVNSHIEEKTGYDREEIIGATPAKFLPEEDVAAIDDDIREMLTGERERLTFESVITTADGDEIPIEGQLALLPPEGTLTGTVGVVRDISERKAREERLERQNERLDRFAGLVSHDLRNPLNVASGRLELVKSDCDSEHIEDIQHAHRRMEGLIDDLLAITRDDEEGTAAVLSLETIAEECWRTVETGAARLEIDRDLAVRGDPSRVKQLLENLYRNAVQHGGEDVTVTVGPHPERPGFYVADDGPGIPPAERDEVFRSGYTTSEEGTGVGLAIVSEVAQAHGWQVSVTADEGGGARFEFVDVEVVE